MTEAKKSEGSTVPVDAIVRRHVRVFWIKSKQYGGANAVSGEAAARDVAKRLREQGYGDGKRSDIHYIETTRTIVSV